VLKMFKKINLLLINFLILTSVAYSQNLTLESIGEFYPDHLISQIVANNNYLFVLGRTPDVYSIYSSEEPSRVKEDAYAFFNIIDLRNSQTVFSSGYLYKEVDKNKEGSILIEDKSLTISDNYVFVGFLRNIFAGDSKISTELTTKVYDISNLPEVFEVGSINIFPHAVSGNRAFVITEEGILVYDIADITNPVLKEKYLKPGIFKIEVEGNRVYIGYYDAKREATFLEILNIRNFSLKKVGKRYLLLKGKKAEPFKLGIYYPFPSSPYTFYYSYAFHIKEKNIYILNGNRIKVVDASNPYKIKKINSGGKIKGSYYNIITNNYGIIFPDDILSESVVILDISDPYNISVAGTISEANYLLRGVISEITAAEQYVIIRVSYNSSFCSNRWGNCLPVNILQLFEIVPSQ